MPRLYSLALKETLLTIVSGYHMPSLNSLDISMSSLLRFEGNTFESLEKLILDTNLLREFSNNSLPRIRLIQIFNNTLTNLTELLQFGSLDMLDANFNQIQTANNHTHSGLRSLFLSYNAITSFNNNNFTNVVSLDLGSNKLSNIVNNHLPNVMILTLTNNNISEFTSNDNNNLFGISTLILMRNPLNILELSHVNMTLQFLNIARTNLTAFSNFNLPQLMELYVANSTVNKITGNSLPKLKILDAHGSQLDTFECQDMVSLQTLDLSKQYVMQAPIILMIALEMCWLAATSTTSRR